MINGLIATIKEYKLKTNNILKYYKQFLKTLQLFKKRKENFQQARNFKFERSSSTYITAFSSNKIRMQTNANYTKK